uniref:ATP synthase subunit 4 n=1 Tax=Blastobotrys adeninivorans TaxID=409370 RepID=A0A060TCW4_BLAAD
MSLRLVSSTARAATRAHPLMATRVIRAYSTETPQQPDPKAKANSILEALPGNTPLSKTGILATGAAATVYAISNGLYVVNAETLMLGAFATVVYAISRSVAPAYGQWAQGHVDAFRNVLNKAREEHVDAVKERIQSVGQLKDVVNTTKQLFAVSKETAELEAKAFTLQQQVDFASEARSVLDSWVRYEGQLRQREQAELAQNVIAKVQKEIENPKFKQQVLEQALSDVEKLFAKA